MKPVTRQTLPNGVSFLHIPQNGVQSMTLLVLVKVGSRYETPAQSGAAHFVEHLMFKGTERRPNAQIIAQELDRYGAEYNAYTGKDLTGYYMKIDATHADTAVDMLHDLVFYSVFNPAEVERERLVILEEINMYEDNPRDHIADLLEEALFKGSSLGRNIAGTRKSLKSLNRNVLRSFHQNYYLPERVTVVAAGKIPASVERDIKKRFGSLPAPALRKDRPFTCVRPPKRIAKPVILQKKETEQTQLALGFYGLPYGHPDREAASLLALILGGSMSSRLFTEIRERRGLCYAIHAAHDSLEDTGILTVAAGLDRTRLPEAIKAIYEELNRMMEKPVSAEELQKAKDHLRGRLALSFEDSATRAGWYGHRWLHTRSVESPEELLNKVDKLESKDILRAARGILCPQRMAAVAIGPVSSQAAFRRMIDWK